MAAIPPTPPIQININGLNGFNAGYNPTSNDVVEACQHLTEITNLHAAGRVGNDMYSDAAVRHHRLVGRRADDVGIAGIHLLLGQILIQNGQILNQNGQILNRLDEIGDRVDGIYGILASIETKMEVDKARRSNLALMNLQGNDHFVSIPKWIEGHPESPNLPPHVADVALEAEYQVGDEPPLNLMPVNYPAVVSWGRMSYQEKRARIRAAYWFYNDPVLALAHTSISDAFERLRSFIQS